MMKSCDRCYWCKLKRWFEVGKLFKCKIHPNKQFDKPTHHGWCCKDFSRFKEVKK